MSKFDLFNDRAIEFTGTSLKFVPVQSVQCLKNRLAQAFDAARRDGISIEHIVCDYEISQYFRQLAEFAPTENTINAEQGIIGMIHTIKVWSSIKKVNNFVLNENGNGWFQAYSGDSISLKNDFPEIFNYIERV